MRTAPITRNLCGELRLTEEQAKHVRHLWKMARMPEIRELLEPETKTWLNQPGSLEARRMAIALYLNEYHGIEYLGRNKQRTYVYYLNAGETYAATLIFAGNRMFISDYGTLVEGGYIRKEKEE